MKIDRKLNLVLKVETDDGGHLYVHSTPISTAVFEKYFYVLAQTTNAILTSGIGTMIGPRVATLMLKRQAENNGEWDGETGVERGFLGEVRRLTNVIVPSDEGGWQPVPLDTAEKFGKIKPEDLLEVMNQVCFFILISSIARAIDRDMLLDPLIRFYGGSLVSFNITEFARSLQTSMQAGNIGVKATVSSIPT